MRPSRLSMILDAATKGILALISASVLVVIVVLVVSVVRTAKALA